MTISIFQCGKSRVTFTWCLLKSHLKPFLKHCSTSYLPSPEATKPFDVVGEIHPKGLVLHLVGIQGVVICHGLVLTMPKAEGNESPLEEVWQVVVIAYFHFLCNLCLLFLVSSPDSPKPNYSICWPPFLVLQFRDREVRKMDVCH